MSIEQLTFQRFIFVGYALNLVFALSLAATSIINAENGVYDAVLAILIMALGPELGAYAISFLSSWLKNAVLTVLLNCVQVFLLGVTAAVQIKLLWMFGFVLYAAHVTFLAGSTLVPWIIYAAFGLGFASIFFGAFYGFKKIISLRNNLS